MSWIFHHKNEAKEPILILKRCDCRVVSPVDHYWPMPRMSWLTQVAPTWRPRSTRSSLACQAHARSVALLAVDWDGPVDRSRIYTCPCAERRSIPMTPWMVSYQWLHIHTYLYPYISIHIHRWSYPVTSEKLPLASKQRASQESSDSMGTNRPPISLSSKWVVQKQTKQPNSHHMAGYGWICLGLFNAQDRSQTRIKFHPKTAQRRWMLWFSMDRDGCQVSCKHVGFTGCASGYLEPAWRLALTSLHWNHGTGQVILLNHSQPLWTIN